MLIRRFSSAVPANDSRQTKDQYGEYAYNTKLWDGTLRAFKEELTLDKCVPEKCSTDAYLCDVEPVHVRDGVLIRPNGEECFLERPEKPVITVSSGGTDPVVFMISAVNSYGDESARSDPTIIYRVKETTKVKVTHKGAFRLYGRTFSTIDGAIAKDDFLDPSHNLIYFGEYEDSADFTFDIAAAPIFDTNDMCRPKNIKCITHNDDGYYAIWTDYDIYISERHQPSLYPIRYKQTIPHKIIEIHPFYDAFTVHTIGKPHLIKYNMLSSGPDAGTIDISAVPYTDIAPIRGAGVRTSFGSMYPSKIGMVALTTDKVNGLQIVTNNIINEDVFEKYIPTVSCWYNGLFFGWNENVGFAYDLTENQFGTFELQNWINIRPNAVSAWVDVDGYMYVEYKEWTDEEKNYHAAGIYRWDSGGTWMPAVWRSKWFTEAGHTVFSRAKVVGDNIEGVVFELWGRDNGLIYRKTVTNDRPFAVKTKRDIEFQIIIKLPKSVTEIKIVEVHVTSNLIEMAAA